MVGCRTSSLVAEKLEMRFTIKDLLAITTTVAAWIAGMWLFTGALPPQRHEGFLSWSVIGTAVILFGGFCGSFRGRAVMGAVIAI